MLSVIICTYNRSRYLYRLMESLAKGDMEAAKYEIVLVDNNCTDNTRDEVERFSRDYPEISLNYVCEPRQGLSNARNAGIAVSRGEILVFVDDDAFVDPDYLSNYEALFESCPEVYAAGGPIIPSYESGEEPGWMTYHLRRLLTGYLYFGEKQRTFPGDNYPGGGNAAYRSSVFRTIGGYDANLGRNGNALGGGEEKDVFRRMDKAGLQYVYTPRSVLHHSIPDYKLGEEYFRNVTEGIGSSERIRTLSKSRAAYCRRLFREAVKWGGTLVLFCGFALRGKMKCGVKLVRFRRNVTKKLLGL